MARSSTCVPRTFARTAAAEVLAIELSENRGLDLMATGMPIRAHMARLDEGSADRLVEVFVRHYRLEREGRARPFPGVLELLQSLRASGNAIAIVTSKLRDDARAELLVTGIDTQIDLLLAFEDTVEHKPHPSPILKALDSLGATQGIGVGDLPTESGIGEGGRASRGRCQLGIWDARGFARRRRCVRLQHGYCSALELEDRSLAPGNGYGADSVWNPGNARVAAWRMAHSATVRGSRTTTAVSCARSAA
jgi:Haloacid dehalogenase-like hydrolase